MVGGPHLSVFDGGYALGSVVRPLVLPEEGLPRIEFLTRLRHDARLYRLPPEASARGEEGAEAQVGQATAAAASRRSVGRAVAARVRVHLRADAEGPLEGGGVLVAGAGA